jgi:hypothetical protein
LPDFVPPTERIATFDNDGSTSCKADDCLWVQVPSGQSRSGQIGIESCGRRGNARSEV